MHGDPPKIVILAVIVSVIIFIVVKYNRQRGTGFTAFANSMGMEVIKGRWWEEPKLRGTYSGRPVQVQDIAHSTGKSAFYTYKITYESASVSGDKVSINISRHGVISDLLLNIGKYFGYKTVSFDNPEFDASVIVRSSNHEFARALIDVELQKGIQDLRKGWIAIKGNAITFEEYGQAQNNRSRIGEVLPLLDKIEKKLPRLCSTTFETYDESGLSSF